MGAVSRGRCLASILDDPERLHTAIMAIEGPKNRNPCPKQMDAKAARSVPSRVVVGLF